MRAKVRAGAGTRARVRGRVRVRGAYPAIPAYITQDSQTPCPSGHPGYG